MIHDLIIFLREVFRPHSNRPAIPDIQRSRELVTESNLRRDRGEQILQRVEDDRETARAHSRLDHLAELIRSDTIAPLPKIWDDGKGSER